jgi:hypothetical protein
MLAMRLVFLAYRTSREEQNKWLLGEARRNDKVTLVRGFWTVLRNVGESPNNGRDEFWHPAERSLLPWRSCPEMGESPGHPPRDGPGLYGRKRHARWAERYPARRTEPSSHGRSPPASSLGYTRNERTKCRRSATRRPARPYSHT